MHLAWWLLLGYSSSIHTVLWNVNVARESNRRPPDLESCALTMDHIDSLKSLRSVWKNLPVTIISLRALDRTIQNPITGDESSVHCYKRKIAYDIDNLWHLINKMSMKSTHCDLYWYKQW